MTSIPVPPVEPRLQKRFQQLVREHLHAADPLTPGPAPLPDPTASAFASTQAAWRFYQNDRCPLPDLVRPLHQAAHQNLRDRPAPYSLAVHDWSRVDFHTHSSKKDQILFTQGGDRGYELSCCLLVDAEHGSPVAPLELRLRTSRQDFSTRDPAPKRNASHLGEVAPTLQSLAELDLPTRLVHVVDCEGDSVSHLRQWQRMGELFLVRSDGTRIGRFQGQEVPLTGIARRLLLRGAFEVSREVVYHGRPATQRIASARIRLERPGWRRQGANRWRIRGEALEVRLVVSRVEDGKGKLLAVWYLLSNVDAEVPAEQLALWYYWRWRIESFFKLLKKAGQQLESWQQQSAQAVARRLVVASMACVLVWQVSRAEGPDAQTLRALLVRLSGRQMKHGVEYTLPALLAGVWVLLSMVEVLEHYDLDQLRRFAEPFRSAPT